MVNPIIADNKPNCVTLSNGCVGARMCHTNNCPVGIATQKEELRQRLNIEKSSEKLNNFLNASTELMKVIARACGHNDLNILNKYDLATWNREMAFLSGVKYSALMDRDPRPL